MKKGLLVFLIICFVSLFAYLFIVFYDEAEKTAIQQLKDQQQLHAQQASQGIGDFFKTWTGTLNSFAKMDEIINVDDDGKRYLTLFYEEHKEQVRAITRVDARGIILYTVPYSASAGKTIAEQRHMREILRDQRPVVSDVFRTVQGFDAVALHVPVFKGATFTGTIAIVIDFASLAQRYLEVIKIGNTGYAWVVGRGGTMLYSPVPGLVGKSIFETCRAYPALLSMVKDMMEGHQGAAIYTFYRIGDKTGLLVRKYAVYMPISILNNFWSIAVASTEDEVLASLASFRKRLLLVVGMILCGGIIFSFISAKAWLIVAEDEKRKKAEEELRESEQRYRHLFQQNPAPMLIYERGTFQMLAVNDAFLSCYGFGEEEALALRLTDFYPEEEKQPIVELGNCLNGHDYDGEWHHLRKNGSLMAIVVRSHDLTYHGRSARIAVITDITDRKRVEEEIRIAHEDLSAINRIITACASSLDADAVLGTTMDEALRITGLEGGAICYVTPDNTLDVIEHRATSQATIEDLTTHAVKVGDCLCGECARNHNPLILRDREAVLKFSTREATRGEDIRFHAAFPLITGQRCVGVLCVFTRTDIKPSENSLRLLETVSAQIAMAIDNARLYNESIQHATTLEEKVQQRTAELEGKNAELERFNKLFVDRELKMVELKERIQALHDNQPDSSGSACGPVRS